jgi:hypothetical protein
MKVIPQRVRQKVLMTTLRSAGHRMSNCSCQQSMSVTVRKCSCLPTTFRRHGPFPLYTITLCTSYSLTCPLRCVKLLTGYVVWFIGSHTVFSICLCIYMCLRGKATLIQLSKLKSYSQNRKEHNRRYLPEILTSVYVDHTLHHLTCTDRLHDSQRQSSNSVICC